MSKWIVHFYVHLFLYSITEKTCIKLNMSNTAGVFIRSWNFLPLASTSWYSQFFCGVRVSHMLYFLYCVFLFLRLSLCRALCPMLHVFLDWTFFIALSVFFNVYFPHVIKFRAFLMSVSYLYLGSKQNIYRVLMKVC